MSQCDLGQVTLIMNHLINILKHKHQTVHDFSVLTGNIMTITLISDVLNKHAHTHTRCEPTESASLELTVDLSHCTRSSRRSLSSLYLSWLGRVSHDVITHTHTYIHTCTHTHTHTYIHTCTHTHTRTYTHAHTHTRTYTHAHTHRDLVTGNVCSR